MTTEATAAEADGAAAPEKNADIPVQSVSPEPLVVATETPAEPEAAASEPAADAAPAADDGKKPVPKLPDWAQKKIADAAFNEREASRKLKAAEEELARLKAPKPAANAADEAAATAAAPVGGYRTQAEFDAAVQQEATKREAAARAAADQQAFDAACNTAYTKGKEAFGDDFDAAVANMQSVGAMNRDLLDMVLALDDPAKALFDLGSNPDRAAELVGMSASKRAIEIAKMGVTAAPAKAEPTKLSAAPRPVGTVDGSARVTAEPQDSDDDATWFAKRNEQVRKRYSGQAA